MTNIFKDEKAPYFLALLIGIVGWLFNASIETAKGLRIVEVSQKSGKDGDVDTVTFYITNKSMYSSIDAGKLNFDCPDEKLCLKNLPSVLTAAQPVRVGNVNVPGTPQVTLQRNVWMPAFIPAKGAVGIKLGLIDATTKLSFRYSLAKEEIAGDRANLQFRVIDDSQKDAPQTLAALLDRWTLLVIANYPTILLFCLLLLCALVGTMVFLSIVTAVVGLIAGARGIAPPPTAPPQIPGNTAIEGNGHV
jgi:hypothetical protein